MKYKSPLFYVILIITFINVLLITFFFRLNANGQDKTDYGMMDEYIEEDTEWQQLSTPDVKLPAAISFAGEEVPLYRIDVKESLKRELIVNTYLHSHTIQVIKKAPRVFAIIEPILKEMGVPEDFKYLAVIESALEPLAVSPSGAVGIWQFMPKTGEEYHLEVNKEVDERYNIAKSTYAAAEYLKKAYERFGSWTMAAAAYNAGSNMIRRQVELQKQSNYYNLLLGEETGRYVFRILALKQIMNHPSMYGFQIQEKYPIEKTRVVKVDKPVKDLADFALENKISYKTLKRFNPWLRTNSLKNTHNKTYEILIPLKPELYK